MAKKPPKNGCTLIMGVLNVTPDSFSDGGAHNSKTRARAHTQKMFREGAHIVDVGGESTRPGAKLVTPEEELRRVLPVIKELAPEHTLSIDTIRAATAKQAVQAGTRYINDVSGGCYDPEMLDTAAWASSVHGAGYIIGHWRGIPDKAHSRSAYRDVVQEVRDHLAKQAVSAITRGVAKQHIYLDPGFGFDKTGEQCWQILRELDSLQKLGYPILIGLSRKRMLQEAAGSPTGQTPQHPLPGVHPLDLETAAASILAAMHGAWGVRVHNVAHTARALRILAAYTGENSK